MKQGVVGIAGVLAVMVWAPLLGAFQATQAGQAQPPVAPMSREFAPKPYTVAAGDKIQLEFYNLVASDLEMRKVYLVEPDGTILVKHVGPVAVHGRTAPEIADLVKKALEDRKMYPVDVVQVTAAIAEERVQRVQVQGQVVTPGEKPLRGNQMTVSRAIAQANGPTPMAGQEIEIHRVVDGKQVIIAVTRSQLDSGDDPPLIAEDIVIVKTGYIFFVAGEVNSVGQKVWAPGMTVGRAVSMSNGMTNKGKYGHIERPIKGPDGKIKEYKKIKGLKPETEILPEDTLHIARKWFG
jgi:protein involved in polysaccharide export with SLBB domain